MTRSTTSIPDAFKARVALHPQKILIREKNKNQTFSDIDQLSDNLASGLIASGFAKKDHIGLYCLNGAEFIICYLAILKIGAVVVPINLLLKPKEISYILSDAQVTGLIYHQAFSQQVIELNEHIQLSHKILIGNNETLDMRYQDLLLTQISTIAIQSTPQDLATILYTSGTTGFPKGAMLSHANFLANTHSVKHSMCLQDNDCLLVVLPMFHSFAATVGILTPLLHGFSLAPVIKFDPTLVSQVIEETQATIFLAVPSMYALLLRLSEQQTAQWSSIRFGISGGSAMPSTVMQSFEKKFDFLIYEGDGPTECSPVTCVNPIKGVRKPNSVGLAVKNVQFKICDEQGQSLNLHEIGEICVSGPSVMQGYWNLPEETKDTFFDQWLRTGDLGYLDEDHYLFIVDRKKDMIIVNGMNVYPRIIEDSLYQHPAIQDVAVVGEPNDLHGEIVLAHVVLKKTISVSELKRYCRDHLGTHEVPRKIIIRDNLPKNATGKIMKRELRREGEIERGIL